ncbi:TPM domain-containing protein [Roseateles sp. BYS180W]|uniref:TPM domain-containing protein n=1 Tax=Roseateles rivi TaxID=3299028 RepID=A0ABW7FQW4_9BURK
MPTWQRWFRHLRSTQALSRALLPEAALQRLQARIRDSESQHSGEIRLCIEARLPWGYLRQQLPPRARALTLFGKLRVWDTEANNGVLIYLLLADRAIEIVADRGLNPHVSPAQWQALTQSLAQALRQHCAEDGLNQALDAVSALLRQHFPAPDQSPNINELPDAVVRL